MKTVILEVRAPKEAMAKFAQSWKSNKQQKSARISFASPELLWKVLTAKRWELLKVLCGAGPVSIRETAQRVKRDVKGVHGDIVALLDAGLLIRTEEREIEFPYEAVRVEFFCRRSNPVVGEWLGKPLQATPLTRRTGVLSLSHQKCKVNEDLGVCSTYT